MAQRKMQRLGAAALMLTTLLPNAGALSGVSDWAKADIKLTQDNGLEPAALADSAATDPITRAEFCSIALSLYEKITDSKIDLTSYMPTDDASADPEDVKTALEDVQVDPELEGILHPFTDCNDPSVLAAFDLGLVSGKGDGTFDPNATIRRQDLCVMLQNVLTAAEVKVTALSGASSVEAFPDAATIQKYALDSMVTMVDYSVINGMQTTLSTTPLLLPNGTASREQALIMAKRFADAFVKAEEEQAVSTTTQAVGNANSAVIEAAADKLDSEYIYAPLDMSDKRALVYGASGEKFTSAADAEANMKQICVKVWRLQADGTKTPGLAYLTVNANIANLYIAVFDEIYNGDEKFPIKDAGSYNWRTGEHSQGTAIDINWEENMEATINADGTLSPTCGTHWTPDTDPYSIPEGGDVYNAFIKYGFIWGGNAWHSKRDYMHFSYFGT